MARGAWGFTMPSGRRPKTTLMSRGRAPLKPMKLPKVPR